MGERWTQLHCNKKQEDFQVQGWASGKAQGNREVGHCDEIVCFC